MKVKFAGVFAIVVWMCAPVGVASAAETAQKKSEAKGAGDAQEKALKELQGDWRVLRVEMIGQRAKGILPTDGIIVNGDEIKVGGSVYKLKLDPGKTPAEIDMTAIRDPDKGKTIAGIYSVSEGRLTICVSRDFSAPVPRPKEFKTQPKDKLELAILERVADAAPRKWLDKTEKHETTAKYLDQSKIGVRLEKTNGKIITVPLDKLSDIDRQYVVVKLWLEGEGKRAAEVKKLDTKVEPEMKIAAESLAAGRMDEAIAHYRKVLAVNPGLAEAHNGLGLALEKNGHMDEAIEHFRKALMINPLFAEAYNGLGAVLLKKGLVREATAQFQKALAIKPDYAEAKDNLEKAKKAVPAVK